MSFSDYVHALGRGPSKARHLTRDEAADAFLQILRGEAAPEAVGALLMLMRYRGENADEIAGFVDAARRFAPGWDAVPAAVDWPSYAAGRTRGLPWFLLSAKLVAAAGLPVFLHGWNSHQRDAADVRSSVEALGVSVVRNPDEACAAIRSEGLVYAPVEAIAPAFLDVLKLRQVLGLRSCVNTVLRVHNPTRAGTTVQGVFHPSYRTLQQDAAARLGQQNLGVIKGGGGEFERHPSKTVRMFGLRDAAPFELDLPPLEAEARRLADEEPNPLDLTALWEGRLESEFAQSVVTGTAAAALLAAGQAQDIATAQTLADDLWRRRHAELAA